MSNCSIDANNLARPLLVCSIIWGLVDAIKENHSDLAQLEWFDLESSRFFYHWDTVTALALRTDREHLARLRLGFVFNLQKYLHWLVFTGGYLGTEGLGIKTSLVLRAPLH